VVRRASLTVRLAVLIGSVTAVLVGGMFVALSLGTAARTRDALTAELAGHQLSLLSLQKQTLQQELVTSALIGETPSLRAALATYREEKTSGGRGARAPRAQLLRTIQSALESMASDLPQAVLILTDDDGKVLFSADRTGPGMQIGSDLSSVAPVKDALDGTDPTLESSFAVISIHDAPFQLGCVPLIQNGTLIGVLLLGDRLDQTALDRIRRTVGSEVVVRTGRTVIASSLPGIDGDVLAQPAASGTVKAGDDRYVIASLPIGRTAAGDRVVLDLLRSVSAASAGLQRSLARNFLLYGFIAVTLSILVAALVARSELRSFQDFVRFMGSVANSRDYSRRFVDPGATAEVRTLTDAYGHLMASLSESHVQLETRGAELSMANAVLRQEVEERQRAEQALRERDEQLRQSQKLEAIGTLAGGVAHDFNNLLTVIHSYAELLMTSVGKQSSMAADLEQIRQAASRAGRLTSQLLAFSRKQVMQPRVLDLNGVVSQLEKMLRRLIGEHIELRFEGDPELARVKADPGQLEQVILNLVVNARDAMPRGGRVSISTRNLMLRESDPALHGETPPGSWVTLSVTDNGMGMDQGTMARIFEPFFTTKGVGQGTGLGLAMVYGIVKQSGGHIRVTSEPGKGSTFQIYLRAVRGVESPVVEEPAANGAVSGGKETILLVEDEEMVRTLGERTLRNHGYTVLTASHGPSALELAERHHGEIELLLTDVVMPQMGGRELANAVRLRFPQIRVLFMTGYTEDTIIHHGVLENGASLLQKPFTPSGMAKKVREVLDAPR
jgi:signal transduction histidine kinase/CheY-like chemotaxis protein